MCKAVSGRDTFSIYPNPANEKLNVSGLNNQNYQIEIYDTYSRLVFKEKSNGINQVIETSLLKDGIYFLKINNELGEIFVKRFIIIH